MRNLKKLLALVLAMVMAFSLMLTAGAVDYDDYPDKDSITAEFDEAVQVLTGLAVMQGDEKGFRPSDKITRAEAAAVIYRAVTGDVTDRQTALYKDYSTFVDVKSDDWFAGYVGYCQNAGYIKGTSPTTFQPYGQVTGYEVLAMILRAVGYGKNNEFTGSSWQVNVAALSKQLGVTRDVTAAHMEQTLNMAAPREVVADLVFMTMATVPMVTYTPALAYNDKQSVAGLTSDVFNPTLGQQVFGLFHDTAWRSIDDWGRPGYRWYSDGVWQGTTTAWQGTTQVTNANNGTGYVTPAGHPLYTAPATWTATDLTSHAVATIKYDPSYETQEQVLECDVAHALEIDTADDFYLFVNGNNSNDVTVNPDGTRYGISAVDNDYQIVATDTVTKVGGQGRQTEFYYELENKWFVDASGSDQRAVMIDTMLARVNAKHDAKLDPAGHVITPAQLEVTIWDGGAKGNVVTTGNVRTVQTASNRIITKSSTSSENWDAYSKGDYILVNALTNKAARNTEELRESAAFQTDKVIGGNNTAQDNNLLTINRQAWIVDNGKDGKAESFQGKQSTVYYNQGKHNVDSKDYMDQLTLFYDLAGTVTNTTFTWYLDQFGNLIGIGSAHAVRYGVITDIYAGISTGDANTDTTGGIKAIATVRYADGTTGTENIDAFRVSWGDTVKVTGTAAATSDTGKGAGFAWQNDVLGYRTEPGSTLSTTRQTAAAATALTPDVEIAIDAAIENTLLLRPVYDTVSNSALSVGPINTSYTIPSGVANAAWLYLAPSTATNRNAHFATGTAGNGTTDAFRLLYDNMFEFSVADDNSVIATEVAGGWNFQANSDVAFLNNVPNVTGPYDNKANGVNTGTEGHLYKTLSYLSYTAPALTVPTIGTANAQQMVYVDNETQILVRLQSGIANTLAQTNGTYSNVTNTINHYDGVSALPGDVTIPIGAEVDWADTDGDGRAEYLYINGGRIPSTITYGLFYYNGTAAQWNGTSGTIEGYLNGKFETLTFNRQADFNTVQTSPANYLGHLFAVQLTNGAVSRVMDAAYPTAAANAWATTPFILEGRNDTIRGALAAYSTFGNWSGEGLNAAGDNFNSRIGFSTGVAGNNADPFTATAALATPRFQTFTSDPSSCGNTYSANTRAVYFRDTIDRDGTGEDYLEFVRESSGLRVLVYSDSAHTVLTDSFWLAPTVDVIGELEWLNNRESDVTIVYEEGAARSVTQIYIAPDPDITPTDNTTTAAPTPDHSDYFTYHAVRDTSGNWSTDVFRNSVRVYRNLNTWSNALVVPNLLTINMSTQDQRASIRVSTNGSTLGAFEATGGTGIGNTALAPVVCNNNEYTAVYGTAALALANATTEADFTNTVVYLNTGESGFFVARNWVPAAGGVPAHWEYALINVVTTVN